MQVAALLALFTFNLREKKRLNITETFKGIASVPERQRHPRADAPGGGLAAGGRGLRLRCEGRGQLCAADAPLSPCPADAQSRMWYLRARGTRLMTSRPS